MSDAARALAVLRALPAPLALVARDGTVLLCSRAWTAPGSPVTGLAGRTVSVGDRLPGILDASAAEGADELAALVREVTRDERDDAGFAWTAGDGQGWDVRVSSPGGMDEGSALVTFRPRQAPASAREGAGDDPGDRPDAVVEGSGDRPADGGQTAASASPHAPAVGSAATAVWILSPDLCRAEWVSPGYEEMFGRAAEALRLDARDFLAAAHPHDRERVRDGLWRQVEGGWSEVVRLSDRERRARTVALAAYPVHHADDRSGAAAAVVVVARDVHISPEAPNEAGVESVGSRDPAAALDAYRSLFASSPVGLALLDRDGGLLESNPALADIMGPIGPPANLGDLLDERDRAGALAALAELLAGGSPRWVRHVRIPREDGEARTLRLQVAPLGCSPGEASAVLVVEDVSEHERLEQQVRQAQRIESVGRLAGGVAHDFNNIMTVIGGHTDLLLGAVPAHDPLRADLEQIRKAADRAASLTGHLLAFSRRNVLRPRLIDPNGVVTGAADLLRSALGERVRLELLCDADVGLVRADPKQLEQVLMHLVVNARDATTGEGEVRIRTFEVELDDAFVDAHLGSAAGLHVAIRVEDDGVGMDSETLSQVFDPFFTTKDPGQGTGLGLAMIYGIVKQSGGYIDVESAPGEGTDVTIYLPRVASAAEAGVASASERSASARADDPGGAPHGPRTILLAEDEPRVRALATRVLEQEGFDVLAAADGRHALTLSRTHPGTIDLLLTDVVMPGMGGRELAERLQAERPGLRVLFTSGYADDVAVRHGSQSEAPFLAKPFSPEDLAQRVGALLDD